MTGAAFFDLDRTLLAGASGPILSKALRAAGLIGSKPLPGERVLFGLFNTMGETLPSMAIARQAASLAKGKSQAATKAAAETAGPALFAAIQPYAARLFAQHRAAGRPLVLATTTPYDLVKPLANLLGFDDVIATRFSVDEDGTYNGRIVGSFVWSTGKLDAVKQWADRTGVDLRESWAYSDSVFDSPLLGAVGHPTAVNPDLQMVVMALLRRWPTLHLDVPPDVPKLLGLEPQRLALLSTRLPLFPYARFDISGTENIPGAGPAILCGNHRSYFDVAAMATAVGRTNRTIRFLGKKEVFDAPIIGQMAKAMGGIRVERGSGSDEPLRAAVDALVAGQLVGIMPQGTIPRGKAFFEPELKGRWGAARLVAMAAEQGVIVPIIPMGLWGTEQVWPRSQLLPNILNIASPPVVTVRVGPPVMLQGRKVDADTRKIMKAITALLPPEARLAREPTMDELRKTLPRHYKGDLNAEIDRRPGTD